MKLYYVYKKQFNWVILVFLLIVPMVFLYAQTAEDLQNSKWYTQVGNRAQEIVTLVAQADGGKGQEGQKIAQASNSLTVGQREQQKPTTPVVINKSTTNNTKIVNNQAAQSPRDTNSASQALVYRAA